MCFLRTGKGTGTDLVREDFAKGHGDGWAVKYVVTQDVKKEEIFTPTSPNPDMERSAVLVGRVVEGRW